MEIHRWSDIKWRGKEPTPEQLEEYEKKKAKRMQELFELLCKEEVWVDDKDTSGSTT